MPRSEPLALVREVPDSFVDCIVGGAHRPRLDPTRARRQHDSYRGLLTAAGYRVTAIPADEAHPDCPFIEDTTVVLGGRALLTRPGAPSRRGETGPVATALAGLGIAVEVMEGPGTLDGGDVLPVGGTVFVGRSRRTDSGGFDSVARFAAAAGCAAVAIEVRSGLHLKSSVTAVGPDTVLVAPGQIDEAPFRGLRRIETAPGERGAANAALLVDGTVIIPEGFPATAARLGEAGIECRTVDVSEFLSADGGVTCLSLRFA